MFGRKKTPEQIEADKKAEAIRFKAEQEERLKLAEEHGRHDALKKYGRFKTGQKIGGPIGSIFDNLARSAREQFEDKKQPNVFDNLASNVKNAPDESGFGSALEEEGIIKKKVR